jgi:hypothetical protein
MKWSIIVQHQLNNLSAISWWEQDTFNEMIKAAELDHLTELDIYYANSLKQQLTCIHITM